ncbi:MAG TPA: hypothetical protein PK113_01745 [Bacillota bacterium]|nr:hypothetical protein [Bacillota bacterium]
MNEYDCIVYGNNIYGLTVALFLARKMRKVLVIQDSSKIEDYHETMDIVDPENREYHFEYNPLGIASGLDSNGLLWEYFDDLGLKDELKFQKISEEMVVEMNNTINKRYNSYDQFKVYLVRHYPKCRNQIHKFFDDLERHYENYILQYFSMLRNREYTLTSLMIEWGDKSLNELLEKYFTSEELRNEFLLNSSINGLNPVDVNSYNFFSNYFVGLKNGFYYLENSDKDIREKIINKLKLINPKMIIKTRIKDIIKDESGKISAIVDKDNNSYSAKYFFVEAEPIKFYEKYFDNLEEDLAIINQYYPNMEMHQKINTIYLAVNDHTQNLGIEDLVYYFKNNEEDGVKIIKLFNYSLYGNVDKRKKQGYLCLDCTYDASTNYHKDELLKRLYEVFPKLKKAVVGVREGKPRKYLGMINAAEIRKNLTINEMIEIEAMEHIQVFENLYLGSGLFRPEAGIFGTFNQAITFADKIEDRLYYGEEDDPYSYLSNEEILMMIRHNFDPQVFGNQEIHVNFHIGKNTYFIRTKGKNIVIHHGKYAYADLSIYTNNDRLSNLLLKKTTFDEVLTEGSLKYRGDKDLLFKAVNAFNLDDYQEYNPMDYKKSKYKNLGAKILFGYFGVVSIAAILTNYINGIFIYPFALLFSGLLFFLKYREYEEVNWFDIFINSIFLVFTGLSVFWKTFNQLRIDDILLGIFALALIISAFFMKKSVVYNYCKFDENIDYRSSILFKVITNGLTFVWGFLFLTILVGTYITGERYVSVLYNLYFVGIFLMYYYPIIYVRTNIKK